MANNLSGVPLPALRMENEWDRTCVRATVETSLAGNALIHEGGTANRPIDLSGDSEGAFMTRDNLLALLALARVVGAEYDLEFNGETHNVRFRHEEGPVLSAEPIKLYGDPPNDLRYRNILIKLMEV